MAARKKLRPKGTIDVESIINDPRKINAVAQAVKNRVSNSGLLDRNAALFGPQLAFVADRHPLKAAFCSRRAGKTHGLAYSLVEAGSIFPGSVVPYITLTRETAKIIIWPAIEEVCQQFNIEYELKENTGDVFLPQTGSRIILRGCDDRKQIDKLRGPKYPLAVVDEAQGFPAYLMELVEDVLEPAVMDYGGQVILTGTPNAICAGPFHDITTGKSKGWSVHHWTLLDNPHLPDPASWLKRKMEQKGWNPTNPTFQREYQGIWIRDADALVYYAPDSVVGIHDRFHNQVGWKYGLGLDVGFNEPCAFVVVAYHPEYGLVQVVETWQETEMLPSDVAAKIRALEQIYTFEFMVIDSGGIGKAYQETMRREHGVSMKSAAKADKAAGIASLNNDTRDGKAKISPECLDLVEQMQILQWDENAKSKKMPKEDRRTPNHLCDAFLYAHRECFHHFPAQDEVKPQPGSEEYFQQLEDKYEEEEEARFNKREEWWESLDRPRNSW